MKIAITTTLGLILAAAASAAPPATPEPARAPVQRVAMPNPVLLTLAEIRDVRSRPKDFGAVLRRCEKEIDYAPVPVATFAPDEHYTATGVNPTVNNAKQLAADSQAAYRHGLCYVVTRDARFATAAQRIVDGWAGTLTSVTTRQGKADINFNLTYMIAAANWTSGVNKWDSAKFDRFLRATILPNSTAENDNNHGMWAMLMEASAATHLGDAQLLDKARTRWIAIMKGATSPDGTLHREVERSGTNNWRGGPDKGKKGIAYTHYFMLPTSMAAKVFSDQGKPVWQGEGGVLLKAAFDKAAAWTRRPETFPYYASNNGQLDGVKSIAHFPLLLRVYENADASAAIQEGGINEGGFLLPKVFAASTAKKK